MQNSKHNEDKEYVCSVVTVVSGALLDSVARCAEILRFFPASGLVWPFSVSKTAGFLLRGVPVISSFFNISQVNCELVNDSRTFRSRLFLRVLLDTKILVGHAYDVPSWCQS